MWSLRLSLLVLLGSALSSAAPASFKSRCEALGRGVKVEGYKDVRVNIAQHVAPNTTIDQFAEGTNLTCTFPNPTVQVDLCRLALRIQTSDSSEVYMEAWLPEKWNSRFLAFGTGGLAGCVFYQELADRTKYGYATVSGNSGHNGTSGGAFLNQPEVFKDFTWRALYATTVVGKEFTKKFYGKPQKSSYFVGCSQGGRQGFKAAQANPELFDGIISGAPGLNLPGLFEHTARWLTTIGTDVRNLTIPIEKWAAIQNETLRQCDNLDGATDGIIEDSRRCKPDLTKLQCRSQTSSTTCLTPGDLSLVNQFFSPWIINNTLIYHGMAHNGNEVDHASTLSSIGFVDFALDWHRFVSRRDPTWTLDRWNKDDPLLAVQQNLFNFNTWDGDLSAFKKRGGKIIHYHGLVDQSIDSTVSEAYYDHVVRTMGASPDDFYRYFPISGLAHCQGGPGASSLGQSVFAPPGGVAPEDDVLVRIADWVEKGRAPDTLRGAKFDDATGTVVEYKRKHCRYPLRNVYKGTGDGKDEDGWRCVK